MGSLNVNRNVSDVFYRYKMPRICAKVEGKGNGIKTVIVNMVEVAKALGRPPTYPTKYFGCELGAQTQFDIKNERFIVNGSHDAAKLQDLLDGFIRRFVLCPECDNPETDLIVSAKRGTISQGCKACGYHGVLDFNHKLNTYILKNPPGCDPATQGSSLTEGNRVKRSKRNSVTNGDHASQDNSQEDGEENGGRRSRRNSLVPSDPPSRRMSMDESSRRSKRNSLVVPMSDHINASVLGDLLLPEDARGRRSHRNSVVSLKDNDTSNNTSMTGRNRDSKKEDDDDTTWTVDVSEEAVRLRMQDLTEGAKCMTLTDDSEKNEKQRMDIFHGYLSHKMTAPDFNTTKAFTEILHEAERLEVKSKAPLVLFELLIRPNAIASDVKKYRALLLRFTHEDTRAQRHALHALELLCMHAGQALNQKLPAVLKLLYDLDIVEEKAFLEWANKPSRKYVSRELAAELRRIAQPFLSWLQEADEESSQEEDEGEQDDFEIEYSDRTNKPRGAVATNPSTAAVKEEEEEGNDVDIDAI